jgi:hypothetical protein
MRYIESTKDQPDPYDATTILELFERIDRVESGETIIIGVDPTPRGHLKAA